MNCEGGAATSSVPARYEIFSRNQSLTLRPGTNEATLYREHTIASRRVGSRRGREGRRRGRRRSIGRAVTRGTKDFVYPEGVREDSRKAERRLA